MQLSPFRADYCGRVSLTRWYFIYILFKVRVSGEHSLETGTFITNTENYNRHLHGIGILKYQISGNPSRADE
jgi:hypothetical protein